MQSYNLGRGCGGRGRWGTLPRVAWEFLPRRLGVVSMLSRLARLIWVPDIMLFWTLPACTISLQTEFGLYGLCHAFQAVVLLRLIRMT
jgi:hypothetical protein